MTNHHDEMRVAPDPSRAEELRRRLHSRLANGIRDEPVVSIEGSPAPMPSVGAAPDDREEFLITLDTEGCPTADEPTAPRRHSQNARLVVAAAAAVVAVVGALLVTATGDDGDKQIGTITPVPTTTSTPSIANPARDAFVMRSVDPDGDPATPLRVTFRVPSEGWLSWFGAVKFLPGDADGFTGLSITTVTNVVSDACRDHAPLDPPVGPTVDDLAIALSQLAPFDLTSPPTDVTMSGYTGKHLELTVPRLRVTGGGSKNLAEFAGCDEGELHSWISPINRQRVGYHSSPGLLGHSADSLGAFNAYQAPGQTEEFWILDVEGTRVVLVSFDSPGSPADDIAERDAIFETIRIEP